MKKRMYRVLALIVLVSILSNGVIPAIAQDKDTSRVLFFTQNLDDVLQEYLSNNIQGILESILNVDGETDFKSVKVGNPLFVYGSDNVFCIPVFCGSGSTYILSLSSSAHGGIIVSYRLDEKQVLKNLPSGIYHLNKNDSTIYLVSENKCIELETDYSLYDKENETITTNECPYLDNKSRCVALTNDILQSYLEEAVCNNRAIIYKSLSVPLVSNYGSYCWAACSASICQYYGYYKTALDVHNFSHGYYHSLSNCTGGSISESYEAIHSFTGLSGTIDYGNRCNAANVMPSINGDTPIYSSWGYYYSDGGEQKRSGHAMVISGYSFNNTTGDFTYTMRDPDENSYQYIYSTYSASSVGFVYAGNTYIWEMSIYDWH